MKIAEAILFLRAHTWWVELGSLLPEQIACGVFCCQALSSI